MSVFGLSPFLRRALLADAFISAATGLLMLIGANVLASLLGLPEALLRYAGLVLLPYGALVAYIATREQLRRWAVWAVIIANAIWAVDSIILLLSGWLTPNALGYAFIIFQALVVAAFAEIQYIGLRRSMTTVA
jgi:glucose uptake protein GlcU